MDAKQNINITHGRNSKRTIIIQRKMAKKLEIDKMIEAAGKI